MNNERDCDNIAFIVTIEDIQQESVRLIGRKLTDEELYTAMISEDSSKLFIDIEDFIPGIIPEIRYATDNNFYGFRVYDDDIYVSYHT